MDIVAKIKSCRKGHSWDTSVFLIKNGCPICKRIRARGQHIRYSEYFKKWREENKERVRGYEKSWRLNNPDKVLAYKNSYREKSRENCRKWRKANLDKDNARVCARYSAKLRAIPAWIDKELIQDIYQEARYQGLHVDHIVPLKGKTVCGLHWEGNLQLLTRTENSQKGNRTWT